MIWTWLLWTGRLGLAWTATDDDVTGRIVATIPVALFVVLATLVAVTVIHSRRSAQPGDSSPRVDRAAQILAGWTTLYWLVRLPMILLGSHPAGFLVVHTVLALLSWGAAAWVLRCTLAETDRTRAER